MTAKPKQSELEQIARALREGGLEVERVEDGALVRDGETRVAVFAEADPNGGVLVRFHLDLDLYVEEEALLDILMGVNLMNQGLDYGSLNLDPVEVEDEQGQPLSGDEVPLAFAVLGRSVVWLTDLSSSELERLREHLRRFTDEVTTTVERTLHGGSGLSA